MATIESIRELAKDRRLPTVHLDRWLAMDEASRAALLKVARELKLRTGQLAVVIDELDEIAVRDATSAAEVLARDQIRRVLAGAGSAPGRARAFVDELRAIRFPALRRAINELSAAIRDLKLPRGIAAFLPKALGSDELTVTLKFRTGAELERMLAAMALARPAIERILNKLGGIDEI